MNKYKLKEPIRVGSFIADSVEISDDKSICVVRSNYDDKLCSHKRIFNKDNALKYGVDLDDY